MIELDDRFTKNDLYLIEDNFKKGNDDFLELFVGDKEFVVPFSCTVGSNTTKQSVARFRNQLFDFEGEDRRKYNEAGRRVRCVEYEGMKFGIPFGYNKEINPEEIAKKAIKKAEVKYNMIINAHRQLKQMGVDVGEITFYDHTAEKYNALLMERNKPALLNDKTPQMLEVLEFLETAKEKQKVVVGQVKRVKEKVSPIVEDAIKKGEKQVRKAVKEVKPVVEEFVDSGIEASKKASKNAKKKLVKNIDVFKKNLKKKIAETEFKDALSYVPREYKVALLAALLIGGAGVGVKKTIDDRKDEKKDVSELVVKKKKLNEEGKYLTFDGTVLNDEYGNLARINELREDITILLTSVEGMANESFTDGKGVRTVGGGNTVYYDDKGGMCRVDDNTVFTNNDVFLQKWRYIEKNMLPIIASVDRKCSDQELKATIGAGFCWGPTALAKSQYFKDLRSGASKEDLTRKLTGFRKQKGLVKREYMLACILNDIWNEKDIANMPVYYIRDKGFLHCAIYTLELNEICKCKTDSKGDYILDKQNNMIPVPDSDDFCTLYLDRAGEILDNLCTPNAKFGKYKRVIDLIPEEFKDYFRPDYPLSKLQEDNVKMLNNKKTINYEDYYAMTAKKNMGKRG